MITFSFYNSGLVRPSVTQNSALVPPGGNLCRTCSARARRLRNSSAATYCFWLLDSAVRSWIRWDKDKGKHLYRCWPEALWRWYKKKKPIPLKITHKIISHQVNNMREATWQCDNFYIICLPYLPWKSYCVTWRKNIFALAFGSLFLILHSFHSQVYFNQLLFFIWIGKSDGYHRPCACWCFLETNRTLWTRIY